MYDIGKESHPAIATLNTKIPQLGRCPAEKSSFFLPRLGKVPLISRTARRVTAKNFVARRKGLNDFSYKNCSSLKAIRQLGRPRSACRGLAADLFQAFG
jgi:hypothetical protein